MKVTLREWKRSDADALAAIANNKKIWDNVRDRLPYPYTKKDAKEWLELVKKQKTVTTFCIEVDGKLAGSIGVTLKMMSIEKQSSSGILLQKNTGEEELLPKP
jgi:RimJ/RimL family protein N-acetyltransferase